MFKNDRVEILGYTLFILGVILIWYQFGWLIALTAGILMGSVVLIIGSFITVTAEWLYKRFDERLGRDSSE